MTREPGAGPASPSSGTPGTDCPLPDRFGLIASVLLFGVPALLLYAATHGVIPMLTARGWEPLLAWFLAGGFFVFAPMLAAALLGARFAAPRAGWAARLGHLRLRRMGRRDWLVAGAALLATYVLMASMQRIAAALWPELSPHPPFMSVQPLTAAQSYLFLLWLPFFAANVIGEELWWRGFIQPRQEPVFGGHTWIVQGVLHGLFHASFGPGVMVVLWPAVFAIPWAVQRTRNTNVGIVVHAGINGPGFLAVTLGLLPA